MTPTTPPSVSEAMREAVARAAVSARRQICERLALYFEAQKSEDFGEHFHKSSEVARRIRNFERSTVSAHEPDLAGPIASEIARITGERDKLQRAVEAYQSPPRLYTLCDMQASLDRAEAAEADLTRMRAETERLRTFVQHCEREVYPLVRDRWALNRTQANAFIDALNDARAALSNPEQTDA